MNTSFDMVKQKFVSGYNDQKQQSDAIQRESDKAREAALRYYAIAARKMGESYKLNTKAWHVRTLHWTNDFVMPILKLLDEKTGLNFSEDAEKDGLNTFGLRNECPVFARNADGKPVASLVFTPGDIYRGQVYIDSGEKSGNYHPDSIGGMNGFGNVCEEVTSLDVIIENLRRRYPELGI